MLKGLAIGLGIAIAIAAIVVCAIPLKTVSYTVSIPYQDIETYHETEPYEVQEPYEIQEPVICHEDEHLSPDSVSNEINSYFLEQTDKPYYWETERVWPPHDTGRQLDETLRDIDFLSRQQTGYGWVGLYEMGVFDCSEMSGCLEYILENKGFTTDIAVGECPKGGHAWVVVYSSSGQEYYVESTMLCRVTSFHIVLQEAIAQALGIESLSLEFYQSPEDLHHTVYGAEYNYMNEFDWWESCSIPLNEILNLLPASTSTPSTPIYTQGDTKCINGYEYTYQNGEWMQTYHTVTKYRAVTKYRDVEKQRTVTKYRQETRYKSVTILEYLTSY